MKQGLSLGVLLVVSLGTTANCVGAEFGPTLTSKTPAITQSPDWRLFEWPLNGAVVAQPDPVWLRWDTVGTHNLPTKIVNWLSETLGLPSIYARPDILIAIPVKLTAARSSDLDEVSRARDGARPIGAYDDFTRTVYLPRGWSPDKPGDQSVLLHQIVYHLQNLAGIKYECPQERARVAFEAQGLWLRETGKTLVSEFGIDPDTLLFMTECYIP